MALDFEVSSLEEWLVLMTGSIDDFKNQVLPCGRREVIKYANKRFHQCAEVWKINMAVFPYKRFLSVKFYCDQVMGSTKS